MNIITLTGKQRKEADRVAGVEIITPWPKGVPQPRGMVEGDEEPASDEAWNAARALFGIRGHGDDYLIRAVRAVMLRRPSNMEDRPGVVDLHLATEMVTPRFYGADDPPPPKAAWWGNVRQGGGGKRLEPNAPVAVAAMRPAPMEKSDTPLPAAQAPALDYEAMPWPDLCRAWRKRRGLTQEGQATVTGVPPSTWKGWEYAAREPSPLQSFRLLLRLLDQRDGLSP